MKKVDLLKMSKEELLKYRDSLENQSKENIDCFYCFRCSYCSYCFHCFDCYACKNLNDSKMHQYMICNVQFTKKEYEKKIKELEG